DEPGDAEVEHNLLHDTWSGVGLDELLPGDPQAYSPGDGLLSSAPLEKALVHIRKALFEPGHRRYRPGCSIPFGLTVTRTEPEERDVSGLRSRSQRFVLPLRFQVDAQGEPHLLREELPRMRESSDSALELAESLDANGNAALSPLMLSNALLASGAFPLAFRARPLCDCALTCPVGQRVSTGTCSGPARGTPVTKLTCARVPPEGQRTLCQRSYVDGGIFDNAPVGLAIDLVESQLNPVPLHPINYLVVDPDFRRHAAAEVEGSMGADPAEPGLWGPMSLFGHLVATARATELSRAIRADGWNRTTQRTLAHAALLFGNFAHLHDAMVSAAGGDPLPPDEPSEMLLASERARLGHLLLDCVRSVRGDLFRDPAMLSACADSLRAAGRSSRSHADAAAGHPLTVPEVIELAHWLSVLSAPGRGESVQSGVPRYFTGSLAHRLEDLRGVRDGSAIASVTVRYLDGELDNVAHA
ncbi:MAG: hypothetical protein JST92_26165, partial [Deltaproteobacteria bacterium]|nr:hypothetical protein [Deltaproteobacteria bacterium]